MRCTISVRREEHEIARDKLVGRNGSTHLELLIRHARQIDAGVGEHITHIARAVKTARRRAAEYIRHTEILHRIRDDAARNIVRAAAHFRHTLAEKRRVRRRADEAVRLKAVRTLESLDRLCRCGAEIAVRRHVISKAGQPSLNLRYIASLVSDPESRSPRNRHPTHQNHGQHENTHYSTQIDTPSLISPTRLAAGLGKRTPFLTRPESSLIPAVLLPPHHSPQKLWFPRS